MISNQDIKSSLLCCSNAGLYYAYNPHARSCSRLQYQGCGGNQNRFESYQECTAVCTGRALIEPTTRPPIRTTTRRPVLSTRRIELSTVRRPLTTRRPWIISSGGGGGGGGERQFNPRDNAVFKRAIPATLQVHCSSVLFYDVELPRRFHPIHPISFTPVSST